MKRSFRALLEYMLGSLKFGPPDDAVPSVNFGASYYEATTPSTASEEFVIEHQLGVAPYLIVPALDLTSSGTQLVPLVTTRPADAQNIYLRSSLASANITVFVEGGSL
jgi:hypothetical protein